MRWIVLGCGVILAVIGYATLAGTLAFESMRSLNCHGAAANCKPVRLTQLYGGAVALVAGTAVSGAAIVAMFVGWLRKAIAKRAKEEKVPNPLPRG